VVGSSANGGNALFQTQARHFIAAKAANDQSANLSTSR
jgi:hypothetical protein